MTSIREAVDLPGMPTWVRVTLGVFGIAMLGVAQHVGAQLHESGWIWSQGIICLVAVSIGIDALHAGIRKRWPLVFFADLALAWLVSRRAR